MLFILIFSAEEIYPKSCFIYLLGNKEQCLVQKNAIFCTKQLIHLYRRIHSFVQGFKKYWLYF